MKSPKKFSLNKLGVLLICVFLTPGIGFAQQETTRAIKAHTEYLSSDALEGRGQGSKGSVEAAKYIAHAFKSKGLQPVSSGSYYQLFKVPGTELTERNVIGIIPAVQPTQESIVFTAHFDGYGISAANAAGDSIYNGAVDNAIGVAALIELAGLYSAGDLPVKNLVFIATAAEEFGAYGSKHYLKDPVFPVAEILFNFNIDGFNNTGQRLDFFVMPKRGVDFIGTMQIVAEENGWEYQPSGWEDTMDQKFDSSIFLAAGVPAATIWTGDRLKDGSQATVKGLGGIHNPDDEINEFWDWSGVEEHLLLYKSLADAVLSGRLKGKVLEGTLFAKSK